jgi:hypothetical protein
MTTPSLPRYVHPVNAAGELLDASFCVVSEANHLSLLFASRGGTVGSGAARNTQYHLALTLVLERMKTLGAVVTELALNSRNAQLHPVEQRQLQLPPRHPLPLRLSQVDDIDRLRRTISDAQKNVATAIGRNPKHGNRMRSLKILFDLRDGPDASTDVEDVERFLSTGNEGTLVTSDPVTLRRRAAGLAASARALERPAGNPHPKTVHVADTKRYLRLPCVVAYVLARACGRCELCEEGSFTTDTGDVYLEVHHIHRLVDGGPDTPDNAAALCANCHRELHYGAQRELRIQALRARVPELAAPPCAGGLVERQAAMDPPPTPPDDRPEL